MFRKAAGGRRRAYGSRWRCSYRQVRVALVRTSRLDRGTSWQELWVREGGREAGTDQTDTEIIVRRYPEPKGSNPTRTSNGIYPFES